MVILSICVLFHSLFTVPNKVLSISNLFSHIIHSLSFLRKNNLSSSHELSRHDLGTIGDLPVITRERIDSIANQLTETITG